MEETLSSSAPDKGEIIIAADYPDQEADFFFVARKNRSIASTNDQLMKKVIFESFPFQACFTQSAIQVLKYIALNFLLSHGSKCQNSSY